MSNADSINNTETNINESGDELNSENNADEDSIKEETFHQIIKQKFMEGGRYQEPWFKELPKDRDNKLYYLGQFMGLLMLGGCVVPTLIQPDSQFITYQMAIIQGTNIVHSLIFLLSDLYKGAKPNQKTSYGQWIFMTVLCLGFWVVTAIACVHDTDNVIDSRETYISKTVANSIMLAFTSLFGVLFVDIESLLSLTIIGLSSNVIIYILILFDDNLSSFDII